MQNSVTDNICAQTIKAKHCILLFLHVIRVIHPPHLPFIVCPECQEFRQSCADSIVGTSHSLSSPNLLPQVNFFSILHKVHNDPIFRDCLPFKPDLLGHFLSVQSCWRLVLNFHNDNPWYHSPCLHPLRIYNESEQYLVVQQGRSSCCLGFP